LEVELVPKRRVFRSLLEEQPDVAATWHPTKNLPITVDQVSVGTKLKAWWICPKGHSYEAVVSNRVIGRGCSFCGGKKVLSGFNDLASQAPILAKEWDADKNSGIEANQVILHSNRKGWWKCQQGHSWEAVISSRARGNGCPVCSNVKVITGENDLATLNPDVAAEWHPTKNGNFQPQDFSVGSGKKFWWICSRGHEWEIQISHRTSKGSGCPYCSGLYCWPGFNDLETLEPRLAREFHTTKNLPLTPSTVLARTTRKLWWICPKGHEYQNSGGQRMNGRGCPACGNSVVIAGFNDLPTTKPFLVDSWHPTKNLPIKPEEVFGYGRTEYWWKCTAKGHEFLASPDRRTKAGCPICSNKRLAPGINDLKTRYPNITKSWHPTRNLPVTPENVVLGNNRKFWWTCDKGHEWQATIGKRVAGKGCGVCANRTVVLGVNDLATTNPEIAATWDSTKNLEVKLSEVSVGTHTAYWWRCEEGHSWKAAPKSRLNGTNCPTCAKSGYDPNKPGYLYFLRHDPWELFQIGITNYPERRLASHKGLGWEVIEVRGPMDGHLTQTLETEMLRALKKIGARLGPEEIAGKFDGYSEAWTMDSFKVASIPSLIELVDSQN
jgi:hypothetical protein